MLFNRCGRPERALLTAAGHRDGVQARWMAHVHVSGDFGKKAGSTFFIPSMVERKSRQGYAKGQTVFILDDPITRS